MLARFIAFVLLALAAVIPGAALASGGLSVSPITLEFAGGGSAKVMEVSNPGDSTTDVQIRLFAWSNAGTEDKYAPSADIAFSPPMFRLAPGARQVVRLAALKPGGDKEQAYRLFVDQLPSAQAQNGVQMPVRMVLPLFVQPQASGPRGQDAALAALTWRVAFDASRRKARLTATNDGPRRVRLENLAFVRDGKPQVIAKGLAGYVLAGQARVWDFDYSGPAQALDIKAQTAGGALSGRASLATD